MGTLLQPLRILIVDTAETETFRIVREFDLGSYDILCQRVETMAAMQEQLNQRTWDAVLSSHALPNFSAIEALQLLQANHLDLPFIVLFDRFEEAAAIAVMQAGAHDCLLKGHLKRLVPTMARELHQAEIRRQKQQTEATLLQLTMAELTERRLTETLICELMTDLNHELRTPLTSLQAAIELLQTGRLGVLSERGQHLLEIAARNADRLVQLTDRMLEPGAFASTSIRSSHLMESVRDR